jgi:hypothetical protein
MDRAAPFWCLPAQDLHVAGENQMTATTTPNTALAFLDGGEIRVRAEARAEVGRAVLAYLDVIGTATGRDTFYNTRADQDAAETAAHDGCWAVNRGLYAALLALPGVTDRAIQAGVLRLLDNPHANGDPSFLSFEQETRLVARLAGTLPAQRLYKLFVQFAEKRVNNSRTRAVILHSVLGTGAALPWRAVKYRTKLRAALRHAFGTGVAHGVAKLAAAADPKACPEARLARYIDPFIPVSANRDEVYQCVAFILGAEREGGFTVPLLKAFAAARTDLAAGAALPVEVLEGVRSRFHKDTAHAKVLEIARAAGTITEGQKLGMQRAAKAAGVEVEFDPTRQDMAKLYVYALETGAMTPEIRAALDAKARAAAADLPVRYANVGVVLDASASMAGSAAQKFRPLAVALAMRDVLVASALNSAFVESTGAVDEFGIVRPAGDTALAGLLVKALGRNPDAVYVITDGYENAPAGRVDEVIRAVRALGVAAPMFQVSPVMGAEAGGLRRLSDELAPVPVSRPEAIGLGMVRAALTADVEAGLRALLALTRPILEANNGEK